LVGAKAPTNGKLHRVSQHSVDEGNRSKAIAAYEDFFNLWKDADPNIPILQQAKNEFKLLKSY